MLMQMQWQNYPRVVNMMICIYILLVSPTNYRKMSVLIDIYSLTTASGVARPGPTRACALPSTFQALPSQASKSHVIL